jgi:hypothetical protein
MFKILITHLKGMYPTIIVAIIEFNQSLEVTLIRPPMSAVFSTDIAIDVVDNMP